MAPGKGSVFLVRRRAILRLPDQYDASMVRNVLQEIAYFRVSAFGSHFPGRKLTVF